MCITKKLYIVNKFYFFLFCLTITLFSACNATQQGVDFEQVDKDFNARVASWNQGENLFAIFDTKMTEEQRKAMKFLYAYMPTCDVAYYSGEFVLQNVDYALKARREMPWGESIPDREFMHFVLPFRVNNENLDSCRMVFYSELKDRVKNLSLYDAVLEVNHWCHEKVTYTPSDSRTSSPLASLKTAYGRCGEESTFAVSAFRAVGIPARQVYTPRWAHTDDNHAWVEVWVDGKWYFLGACEPEPVLNLAWFNAPASRGMLMHTKVFGNYSGPEDVVYKSSNFTEINIIDNYAPCSTVNITVVDTLNNPVPDAKVEFKLYNYAELYSIATKKSDVNGKTSLMAGKGDLVVWASKDGIYGFKQVSFKEDADVTVVLDKDKNSTYSVELTLVPPVENANLPEVTPEQRAENNRRFAIEDSIRNAYIASFMSKEEIAEFALKEGLETASIEKIIVASRGNYATLCDFLSGLISPELKQGGIELLNTVSAKDLRDVSLEVLNDHIQLNTTLYPDEIFSEYIRNPRVANEMITAYKSFFANVVSEEQKDSFVTNPMALVSWVAANVMVDSECNKGGAPIQPMGVWKSRRADALSRDIFFVSMARSLGIPARIDIVTGKVQFYSENKFVDVKFSESVTVEVPQGVLVASYSPSDFMPDPKYYYHFTLSKVTDEGSLHLLNYDEEEVPTWSSLLKNGTNLDCGNYLMVSGTRLANGGVLASLECFAINENNTTNVELVMRESTDDVQVIGNFNSESKYKPVDSETPVSILSTTGRGYYVVAVLGVGQEPTNHALKDIILAADELEKWNRQMILLFGSEEEYAKFRFLDFEGLPANITFGIDIDGAIQKQIAEEMKYKNSDILPMVIIGDTFNRVVFASQGYTIGLGEQLLKVIHKL